MSVVNTSGDCIKNDESVSTELVSRYIGVLIWNSPGPKNNPCCVPITLRIAQNKNTNQKKTWKHFLITSDNYTLDRRAEYIYDNFYEYY